MSNEFSLTVLDEIDRFCYRHWRLLRPIQEELELTCRGKTLLLVDANFGSAAESLRLGLESLEERGCGNIREMLKDRLFFGTEPTSTREIFQQFLGRNINLQCVSATEAPTSLNGIAAVIFSGSPADILGPQEKGVNVSVKTHGRKVGFTNEQIRDNCLGWYRLAEVQNLPVLGICYGHQLISWANGNEVVPMVETIKGWTEVSLMNDQKRLMYRLFGTDWNFDGIVPVHHKRQVRLCPSFTRPFLRSARGGVIHGAIHCKFGGDISDSLSQGRHLALTYQGHPEYAPLQPIKDYRQSGDLSVFKVSMSDIHRVAPDMLLLWARLLGRHARF